MIAGRREGKHGGGKAQNQNAEVPASRRRDPVAIRRYSQNPINAPEAHANEIRLTGVHSFRGVTRPLVTFRVVFLFFVFVFFTRTAGMGKRGRGGQGKEEPRFKDTKFLACLPPSCPTSLPGSSGSH